MVCNIVELDKSHVLINKKFIISPFITEGDACINCIFDPRSCRVMTNTNGQYCKQCICLTIVNILNIYDSNSFHKVSLKLASSTISLFTGKYIINRYEKNKNKRY